MKDESPKRILQNGQWGGAANNQYAAKPLLYEIGKFEPGHMNWRATTAGWGNEENDRNLMQSVLASLSSHAIPAPGWLQTKDTLKSLKK